MTIRNWLTGVSGLFSDSTKWGGTVPGSSDDANIDAVNISNPIPAFTVTSSQAQTVNSISTVASATLALTTAGTFTATNGTGSGVNAGTISIGNNTILDIGSHFDNAGKITLNATSAAFLELTGTVNLNGHGSVVMSANANNVIRSDGAAAQLNNIDNVISGSGLIGDTNLLTLDNKAAGIINANGTVALTLNTGTNTIINTGFLEATNSGGLKIASNVDNTNGLIEAIGATAHVDLSGATITNGVLTTLSGGKIQTLAGDHLSELDGSTDGVANAGLVVVTNNSSLLLAGEIGNAGTIQVNSSGLTTDLKIVGNVFLDDGGKVILSDNAANAIDGSGTLQNDSNTISGAGTIGNGNLLTLINEADGVISATGVQKLTLATGTNAITNHGHLLAAGTGGLVVAANVTNTGGILEAHGAGGLVIQNTVTGGTVEATAVNAHIDMSGGTISGAEVSTVVGSKLQTLSAHSGTIDLSIVDNAGSIIVNDNSTLTLGATVHNTGTINVSAATNATSLLVNAHGLTLDGGGKVILTDNVLNAFASNGASAIIENVDNIISGAGTIGNATTILENDLGGTINANGTKALTINTGGNAIDNVGLLQSSGAGGLVLSSILDNSGLVQATGTAQLKITAGLDNSGSVVTSGTGGLLVETDITNTGTMQAAGTGGLVILNSTVDNTNGLLLASALNSHIDLQNSEVDNGTIATLAGGKLTTIAGTIDTIDTVAVNNSGAVQITDNSELILNDVTVVNAGSISLAASANTTKLGIDDGGATLQGGGTLTLTDNLKNQIVGAGTTGVLTNINDTISGAGTIGVGDTDLTLLNVHGTINATGVNALTINTGNVVVNSGSIKTSGTGGIVLKDAVTNTGGTISASGTGGLNLQNVITGGIVAALGATSHIDLNNGTITSANVSTVVGAKINTLATTTDQISGAGTIVNNAGSIIVADNSTLKLGGTINNTGSIQVNSTNDPTNLDIVGATSLRGGGQVTLGDNSHNVIQSNGPLATLTNVNDIISGAGDIGNDDSNFHLVNNGLINSNKAVNALILDTGGNTITNTGTIEVTGLGGMQILSDVTNTGTIETLGVGNFGLLIKNADITNTGGTVAALGSGNHIDLQDATIDSGTITTALGAKIDTVNGSAGNAIGGFFGTLNNAGSIIVNDNSDLTMNGVANNTGTISVHSTGTTTTLKIGDLALTGHGALTLTDDTHNTIIGDGTGSDASETVTVAGTATEGDTVNLTFTNPTLNGGNAITVSYLVQPGDNATDIAAGLSTAITTNFTLHTTGGIDATPTGGGNITITEPNAVGNATTITQEVDGNLAVTIGGTETDGDKISLTFTNAGIGGSPITVSYTSVVADSTTADEATGLAAAISANPTLVADHITAVAVGSTVNITEIGDVGTATTVTDTVAGQAVATIGGTETDGDTVSLIFTNPNVNGGNPVEIDYTTQVSDSTTADVASGLKALINANATLAAAGITATTASNQVIITDLGTLGGTTVVSDIPMNTETFTLSPPSGQTTTETVSYLNDVSTTTPMLSGETVVFGNGGQLSGGGTALENLDNTISGAGFIGDATMSVINGANGTINANGTHLLDINAGILINNGLVESTSTGGLEIDSVLTTNNSSILAKVGTIDFTGDVTGNGTATISGSGSIDFGGTSTAQDVVFAPAAIGTLVLENSTTGFDGTISGFKTGSIDLADINWIDAAHTTATYTANGNLGGTLVITDGTHTTDLHLIGTYVQANFHLNPDGNGGTLLTDPPTTVPPTGQPPTVHLIDYGTGGSNPPDGGANNPYLSGNLLMYNHLLDIVAQMSGHADTPVPDYLHTHGDFILH